MKSSNQTIHCSYINIINASHQQYLEKLYVPLWSKNSQWTYKNKSKLDYNISLQNWIVVHMQSSPRKRPVVGTLQFSTVGNCIPFKENPQHVTSESEVFEECNHWDFSSDHFCSLHYYNAVVVVVAQISDQFQIRCRLCVNAITLGDCLNQTICDNRTEVRTGRSDVLYFHLIILRVYLTRSSYVLMQPLN